MKSVLMIGGAGTTVPVPPIREGQERWGLNNLIRVPTGPKRFKGATRWFDLHHKPHIVNDKAHGGRGGPGVWNWYQKLEIPLYMWDVFPDLPTSRVYPLADVQRMFGGTRLFCSTLDYKIALALLEGFEEIELYAYRMGNPMYKHQVSSGRWWLKQCAELGVVVKHLSPSALANVVREVDAKPPRPEAHHLMYGLETTDRSLLYRGR